MKTVNLKGRAQGFTLIEVVLVLAIAGLIFLIVFLALPALQRSQRDTQRKNDVGRFISQLTNYQSNNQGTVPSGATAWGTFVSSYLTNGGQSWGDPQSGSYTLQVQANNTVLPNTNTGNINIYQSSLCDSNLTDGVAAGNSRQVAVVMPLEQGGLYCQNN